MPKSAPLPDDLGSHFTVARARELGLGVGRLRSGDLTAPFHGVRSTETDVDSEHPFTRALAVCRSLAPMLAPHHVFSHTTAALLWGCPLPRRFEALPPVHVTSLAPARALDRQGVIGHRIASDRVTAFRRHGLPVCDPAMTFLGLATMLELDDLVAVADYLVLSPTVIDPRDIRPYIELNALRAAAAVFSGRGRTRAVEATALMRAGVESVRETHLRLLLVRAGCPEPEVNPDLYSSSGAWLGRADLVFRAWKVIVEYDGDQHRTDVRQYEKDIERVERFTANDWIHLRVRKSGLGAGGDATVRRVRSALRERGWRP